MSFKLAIITPTAFIEEFGNQGDFHLGLSHLLDNNEQNEYEKKLVNSQKEIFLDNGLFENHFPEGINDLFRKALRIKASYVFAPDYLFDAERTLSALKNAIYIKNKIEPFKDLKLAAVVQADNEGDFFDLYDELQKIPEVGLIGLSILAVPRCFGSWNKERHKKGEEYKHNDNEITSSRVVLLKKLLERGNNTKPCHLLGLGNSFEDVLFAKENCPWIISNDTSSYFTTGINLKKFNDALMVPGGKVKEKLNFNLTEINALQRECIQYNINKAKSYVSN